MTVIENGNVKTKWQVAKKNLSGVQGFLTPRPRYGHRVVSMRGLILLFGGGDQGIIDDLLVYSTENGNWFQPSTNGQVPNGAAAFGMAADGTRIIVHGGMLEYGKMSNYMYELQASKWEWKKLDQKCSKGLKSIPSSRMCHSFETLGGKNNIPCIDKVVLFGGVRNCAENPEKQFRPEYLNDVYYLELLTGSGVGAWIKPEITGVGPSPRESHSAVIYKPEGRSHMMVIYGGKDKTQRLGDLWSLDTGTNTWTELKPLGNSPLPRSLHTSILVSKDRMVVIGGIKPKDEERDKLMSNDDASGNTVWEQDDSVYILDLNADEWLDAGFSGSLFNEKLPAPRSHAAAALIDTRIYLFAGKEGETASNSMLFLETAVPAKPANLRLLKGGETSIEVAWNAVKNSERYLVQICPMGMLDKKKKMEKKNEIDKTKDQKAGSNTISSSSTPIPTGSLSVPQNSNTAPSTTNTSLNNVNVQKTQPEFKSAKSVSQTSGTKITNENQAKKPDQSQNSSLERDPGNKTKPDVATNEKVKEEVSNTPEKTQANPDNSLEKKSEENMEVDQKGSTPMDVDTKNDTPKLEGPSKLSEPSNSAAISEHAKKSISEVSSDRNEPEKEASNTKPEPTSEPDDTKKSAKLPVSLPVQLPMLPGMSLPGLPSIKPTIAPVASSGVSEKETEKDVEKTDKSPAVQATDSTAVTKMTKEIKEDSNDQSKSDATEKSAENLREIGKKPNDSSDITSDPNGGGRKESEDAPEKQADKQEVEDNPDAGKLMAKPEITTKQEVSSKPQVELGTLPEAKQEMTPKTEPQTSPATDSTSKTDKPEVAKPDTCKPIATKPEHPVTKPELSKPENPPKTEKPKDEAPAWYDVALTQGTRHEIKSYFVESDKDDSSLLNEEVLFLDSDKSWKKQSLGSGITYRVRICAINSCGRSVFSDHSAYKTIVPGFPRAPTSIKVSKTDDGASLSWSPPVNTEIIEYSVYLAVKQNQSTGKTNNFIRVYLGDQPNCIVSHSSLAQAATNTESSNKPAVIFRIAAKNKKGYGPATQVRWLQDSRVKRQAQNIKNEAAKKAKTS